MGHGTWRHGDMKTRRHEDIETWRHGDIETQRFGDRGTWGHGDIKRKTEAQAIFLVPFTVCSSANGSL
jgi:hypothetical protein